MSRSDLIRELRTQLQDDRSSITAFTLAIADGASCDSAVLEITGGYLTITVEGGRGADSIRWMLDLPNYNTVGKLLDAFGRQRGYVAAPSEVFRADHPSSDLRVAGAVEIGRKLNKGTPASNNPAAGAQIQHHLFGDETLREFLEQAVVFHNPTYTLASLPQQERGLVLLKARAIGYRAIAALAARSKNLGFDAENYLSLARDTDAHYLAQLEQNRRVIPVAKADESKMGTGDAVQGTVTRRGLRANMVTPYASAKPPTPPKFHLLRDTDVQDTQVRLTWQRSVDADFAYWELWRDTRPEVERSVAGRLVYQPYQDQQAPQTEFSQISTSKQVFGIYRNFASYGDFFFGTWSEIFGVSGLNASFVDGGNFNADMNYNAQSVNILGEPLEPDTTYYYRMYAFNLGRDATPSEIIRVHTKKMRARLKRDQFKRYDVTALSPREGPLAGGTSVTVSGANFMPGMRIVFGVKEAIQVPNTLASTSVQIISPAYFNSDMINKPLDVFIESPDKQIDLAKGVWTYK